MLIPSDRHTPQDLAHWREMEAADLAHGSAMQRADRDEKPVELMRRFAAAGPCYVSVSWGKDSVVTAHLLAVSGLKLPLVHIVQEGPQYDRQIPLVRDTFLSRHPADYHEVRVEPQQKEQRDGGHAPGLDVGIRRAAAMFGTRRYIGGVRASESSVRKTRVRRGLVYGVSCCPIGWWSAQDVFGWIAAHDLPLHPSYAMTGGGRWPRDQIRVSIIGGKKGTGMGRREWESEYYGDVLRRIEAGPHPENPAESA